MCTNIQLTSKSNNIFFGRTMDLNFPMFDEEEISADVKYVSIPKGAIINSPYKKWKSKYNVLGLGTNKSSILYDGINEHGLSGDAQVLMEATYLDEKTILEKNKIPLLGEEFVTYILTNFKNVEAIREKYSDYALVNIPYKFQGLDIRVPLHYTFLDITGDGIVLEPVSDGLFKIYDYIGVMTNSPGYDFHLTNIRNFIGVDNKSIKEKKINSKLTLTPIENGTGYGLWGIPGDYTSPSRFIRSFYYKNMIDKFSDIDGIDSLYSVFKSVMIPKGIGRENINDKSSDYTRYWSGYDLSQKKVYVQVGQRLRLYSKSLEISGNNIEYKDIF